MDILSFFRKNARSVHIFESECAVISCEAAQWQTTETGGDVFGTFTHGGMPVIWLATGPGPRARREHAEFEQDIEFRTKLQDMLTHKFAIQFIGSWHSHHRLGLDRPSRGDVQAVREYAARHGRRRNVEIIVTLDGDKGQPSLHPYVYLDAESGQHDLWTLNILPGSSPLRTQLGQERGEASAEPGLSAQIAQTMKATQSTAPALAATPEMENEIRCLSASGVDLEDLDLDESGGRYLMIFRIHPSVPFELAAVIEPTRPPQLTHIEVLRAGQVVRIDLSGILSRQGLDLHSQPFGGGVLARVVTVLRPELSKLEGIRLGEISYGSRRYL